MPGPGMALGGRRLLGPNREALRPALLVLTVDRDPPFVARTCREIQRPKCRGERESDGTAVKQPRWPPNFDLSLKCYRLFPDRGLEGDRLHVGVDKLGTHLELLVGFGPVDVEQDDHCVRWRWSPGVVPSQPKGVNLAVDYLGSISDENRRFHRLAVASPIWIGSGLAGATVIVEALDVDSVSTPEMWAATVEPLMTALTGVPAVPRESVM